MTADTFSKDETQRKSHKNTVYTVTVQDTDARIAQHWLVIVHFRVGKKKDLVMHDPLNLGHEALASVAKLIPTQFR